MARRFLTAEDVRRAGGPEVVVDEHTVVTPHALEAAQAAGIAIRTSSGGPWTASSSAPDRGPDAAGGAQRTAPLPEPPADPGVGTAAVVTAVGRNRPGVLSEITGAVAELGGNIHDVSQKVVEGYFQMVLVVELVEGRSFHDLKSALECMGGPDDYAVTVMHERVFRFMHRV
ncbi:MAG: ACT domain-containing protein [Planctomycetota bacterium]